MAEQGTSACLNLKQAAWNKGRCTFAGEKKKKIILNQMVLNPSDKLQEPEIGKVSILNNLEDFQKYYHLLKQPGAENSRQTNITDENAKVLNPAGHLLCLTT